MSSTFIIVKRNRLSFDDEEAIFNKLEVLGYKTLLVNKVINTKHETISVWVAVNSNGEVITCESGMYFSKDNNEKHLQFTEEEYNIIRGE